jgi:ribosomal protein S18 acetylase RimI-like enzyme
METQGYEIRTMMREEIDLAVEWAAQEGWNPGLHDAECFYLADPKGFSIGLLDGKAIGSISAVSYGDSYGFIGFYIVTHDCRGQGFGIQLWHEAMKRLSGRNIGLDGVLAQQENYKKSGFRLAHRNIRYQWRSDGKNRVAQDVVRLSEVPREELAAYDAKLFGLQRERFLECWISRPQTVALGILQSRNLVGYGVLRKCRDGFKIGPLFADGPDIAEALFLSLTRDLAEGSAVFLDVPEVNSQGVRLAEKYNMTKVFETARMYTKEQPNVPLHQWFGVTTFELG